MAGVDLTDGDLSKAIFHVHCCKHSLLMENSNIKLTIKAYEYRSRHFQWLKSRLRIS